MTGLALTPLAPIAALGALLASATCLPAAGAEKGRVWKNTNCYHVFRVRADGSRLVQLTDGPFNEFDPCFLPGGRIAFISERRGGYVRCGTRACRS